jgi:multicomponent Na+:H+ antiporter subunit G
LSAFLDVVGGVLVLVGCVVALIGSIGLLRFPDFFTRMHAAGVTDTLGAGAVLLGLAIIAGSTLIAVKLLFVFAFLLLTNPSASHALGRSAMHGERGREHLGREEAE